MDARAERAHLLEQIEAQVDDDYREGLSGSVPTELKIYGVRVPHLRAIARDWKRMHKTITHEELIALLETLWAGASREERMLVIYLLGRYKRCIPDLTWAHFERWRRDLDNWEVSDGLAQWVLAPWILADPDARLPYLRDLIVAKTIWSRRLALVATVPINRKHDGLTLPDLTRELLDQVKAEQDPMITKAISWALREMTKTHPEVVAAYLEENREVLAAHVVREVTNKLETGRKSG